VCATSRNKKSSLVSNEKKRIRTNDDDDELFWILLLLTSVESSSSSILSSKVVEDSSGRDDTSTTTAATTISVRGGKIEWTTSNGFQHLIQPYYTEPSDQCKEEHHPKHATRYTYNGPAIQYGKASSEYTSSSLPPRSSELG
jgi:hypothetical protein